MSWGYGPWGLTPWGGPIAQGGPRMIALILAEPVRENVVRLTFDAPVYFSRWHDPPDAAFVDRYRIVEDATAIGLDGNPSRPVAIADVRRVMTSDGSQIDVWLDRALSPTGSAYTISCANLKSADLTLSLDPTKAAWTFSGVHQGLPVLGQDMTVGNRDFANPQMPGAGIRESELGQFTVDSLGDYGIDQGLASYKKRVFRRLTTRKGSFRHLPGYGVSIPQSVKKLARANLTDSIAADAEDQIRQEPETQSVSVQLIRSNDDPNLFIYRITAQTSIGQLTDYAVPVPA
jgi:hypothetical protein